MLLEISTQTWSLCGVEFTLDLWPEVFRPTSTSECIAQVIKIQRGEVVIDMGCGSGFMAILAAKLGAAHVLAVDVMPHAIELTRLNAARNGVADRVEAITSHLFAELDGITADCIMDDVSGVAEKVARNSPWYPPTVPAGGTDGSEPTVDMLQTVSPHLRPGGRLLLPVASLSNEARTLDAAHRVFTTMTLVADHFFPFPKTMREVGQTRLVKRGSRWCWELRLFECRR